MKKLKNILIVDDDQEWLQILRDYFTERAGIKPCVANNGREALEAFEHTQFDWLLTDTNMPGLNGIDLLARIKSKFPQTWVVVFFEGLHGSSLTKKEVEDLGADLVIKKLEAISLLPLVAKKLEL